MTTTANSLKQVLADSYALYLKTQNYHWNVTGPNFQSLHALFEEQYTDLATAIDDIAERIRTLGEKAPGAFSEYAKLTAITEGDVNADASTMVKHLIESNNQMVESLKQARDSARESDDDATEGLMIDRITVHEKALWMLQSSL